MLPGQHVAYTAAVLTMSLEEPHAWLMWWGCAVQAAAVLTQDSGKSVTVESQAVESRLSTSKPYTTNNLCGTYCVMQAAEVLSDPAQRRQYDYELGAAAESRTPRPGRAAT